MLLLPRLPWSTSGSCILFPGRQTEWGQEATVGTCGVLERACVPCVCGCTHAHAHVTRGGRDTTSAGRLRGRGGPSSWLQAEVRVAWSPSAPGHGANLHHLSSQALGRMLSLRKASFTSLGICSQIPCQPRAVWATSHDQRGERASRWCRQGLQGPRSLQGLPTKPDLANKPGFPPLLGFH